MVMDPAGREATANEVRPAKLESSICPFGDVFILRQALKCRNTLAKEMSRT